MKTKTKLIVSITSLCLVVVAAVISVVTVFALINNGINIGGSITFTAKNIYATVSAATLSGGTLEDADNKLQQIDYNATSDGSAALATWSDLNLTFPESGDDVTITFSVANNSTTEALRVSVGELTGTAKNATMAVAITGKDAGTTTVVIPAKTGESAESAEFTITFHIIDKNESASIKDFDIPLTMEGITLYNLTVNFSWSPYDVGYYDYFYGLDMNADGSETNITRKVERNYEEYNGHDTFTLAANTIVFILGGYDGQGFGAEFNPDPMNEGMKFIITQGENTYEIGGAFGGEAIYGDKTPSIPLTEDTTISVTIEYVMVEMPVPPIEG